MLTRIIARQQQRVIAAMISGVNWGQKFIAKKILPEVNTYGEAFTYETWGNDGLTLISNVKRSLGGPTKTVLIPENSSIDANLEEIALAADIDYRELNAADVQDRIRAGGSAPDGLSAADRLRAARGRRVDHNLELLKEQAVASLVFGVSSYDSGNVHLDVDFNTAGIIERVKSDLRKVEKVYGFRPNKAVFGWQKWLDLTTNPEILDRVSGGANMATPADVTKQLVAALFEIDVIEVGTAVIQPLKGAGETAALADITDIWNENYAAFIYTGPEAPRNSEGEASVDEADLASPAFGKIFFMDVPSTGVPYDVMTYDRDGNGKVERLEVTEFYLVGQAMKCGALYKPT